MSTAVFIATVEQVLPGFTPQLHVDKVYKGSLRQGQTVLPEPLQNVPFENSMQKPMYARLQYLVFWTEYQGIHLAPACGRTKLTEVADEDIAELNRLQSEAPANDVHGTVLLALGPVEVFQQHLESVRLARQTVRLINVLNGFRFDAMTDEEGNFSYPAVLPGQYRVETPGRVVTSQFPDPLIIPDRGCLSLFVRTRDATPRLP